MTSPDQPARIRRVLLIGQSFASTPIEQYAAALKGHYEVRTVDPYALGKGGGVISLGRMAVMNGIASRVASGLFGDPLHFSARSLLRRVEEFEPDLIFTDCVSDLHPDLLGEIRQVSKHAYVVGLFSDAISNFQRGYFFMADYDRLFFKDHFIVEKLRAKLGWSHIHYLPEFCDPRVHRTVAITDADRSKYGCDIGSYGSMYLYRARYLQNLKRYNVKVWGAGLPRFMPKNTGIEHMVAPGYLHGDTKCKAMLCSKIALNFNHYAEITGTNKRTFELAGIGAFQLTDAPAIADVFEPGKEVVTFDDHQSLLDKIDHYLDRPDERAAIGKRGQARAYRDHTCEHRWVAMLQKLGLAPPASFPVQPGDVRVSAL